MQLFKLGFTIFNSANVHKDFDLNENEIIFVKSITKLIDWRIKFNVPKVSKINNSIYEFYRVFFMMQPIMRDSF